MQRIINNKNKIVVRKQLRRNQTPQEVILWSRLRNNKTKYKWKRQVSIGPYITDFYCRQKLLVIEIDGSQHIDDKKYDDERDLYFLNLGIITIRFWNNEINTNIDGVMQKIVSELEKKPHPSPLLKGEGVSTPAISCPVKGRSASGGKGEGVSTPAISCPAKGRSASGGKGEGGGGEAIELRNILSAIIKNVE